MDDRIAQELLDEQKQTNTNLVDIEIAIENLSKSINDLIDILKIGNDKNANAKTQKR